MVDPREAIPRTASILQSVERSNMSVYPGAGLPRPDLTHQAHEERHRDQQERAREAHEAERIRPT